MKHSTELTVQAYRQGCYDPELLGLFDKQLLALSYLEDNHTNETLYGGGARGGKSWLAGVWQTMRRLAYSGSAGFVAREELARLKDTTQKTFFEVVEDFFGLQEGWDYVFHSGKQTVEWYNGSITFFREMKYKPQNDPEFDRLGSYDLTDATLDECQQIHWKGVDVLKGRYSELTGFNEIRRNGIITKEPWHTIPKALLLCNPAKNWIHTDFYTPWKNKVITPDKIFIPSLASDNPHVSQSYIDNLKRADKITRERLLYGNFDYDDDPLSLCSWEAICDIFNNDHIKPDETDRWLVSDLAMMGRDSFITVYWEGDVCYICFSKPKATGKSIEDDLKNEKRNRNVPNRRIIADSDGMGSYLSSYLENIREFHGGASPKDKQYGNLKDECAFKLAEKINNSEMRIKGATKEQQEEIKRQLSTCLKRKDNIDDEKKRLMPKSEQKEKLGGSPDWMDVLIMSMHRHIKQDYNAIL